MFLKTLDEKQKFYWKNLKLILKISWHSDLHGKMNLNIQRLGIGLMQQKCTERIPHMGDTNSRDRCG